MKNVQRVSEALLAHTIMQLTNGQRAVVCRECPHAITLHVEKTRSPNPGHNVSVDFVRKSFGRILELTNFRER